MDLDFVVVEVSRGDYESRDVVATAPSLAAARHAIAARIRRLLDLGYGGCPEEISGDLYWYIRRVPRTES